MDILVCVKLVSESHYTDSFQDVPGERLSSGRLAMNPADEYALELALRLRESAPGSRLTVLTMAPKSAEPVLRYALAMGADQAVHICDPCFAGSDTLVTSAVLAGAIRKWSFQGLILCGQKAIDSETGHIGPQLSVQLGLPVVTGVLSLQQREDGLQVEQVRDEGTVTLACPASAILAVCRGTQMVRRPTISGLRAAHSKTIQILCHQELSIVPEMSGAAGSPTKVVKLEPIIHHHRGGIAIPDAQGGVGLLVRLLAGKGGG